MLYSTFYLRYMLCIIYIYLYLFSLYFLYVNTSSPYIFLLFISERKPLKVSLHQCNIWFTKTRLQILLLFAFYLKSSVALQCCPGLNAYLRLCRKEQCNECIFKKTRFQENVNRKVQNSLYIFAIKRDTAFFKKV